MKTEDRKEFNALLITSMAMYERQVTPLFADMFFAALGQYSIAQVRDGFNRHLQDPAAGKFSPKPADVIGQIAGVKADDGRPGKDAAWAIALQSLDELDTVFVTEEILAALAVARPLLEIRDKVAARLAFVELYEKQVAQARRGNGSAVKWNLSLGDDKGRRQHAVEEGLRLGYITQAQAQPHLLRIGQETQPITADGSAIAGLLAGPVTGKPLPKEENQRRLHELRNQIGKGARELLAEKTHREAVERRVDTERRKRAVEDQIQGKTANSSEDWPG